MPGREQNWASAMRAERQGDSAAYARLLGEIARTVRVIVASRLGSRDTDIEDIIREVMIGIHAMRHRWDAERPILPWVHAISRYKINDALRRRMRDALRRRELSFEEWAVIAEDRGADLEEAGMDMERHLRALSPGQQDIVRSLAIEGRSVREVAQRLQRSEGSIRVVLHTGPPTASRRKRQHAGRAARPGPMTEAAR